MNSESQDLGNFSLQEKNSCKPTPPTNLSGYFGEVVCHVP